MDKLLRITYWQPIAINTLLKLGFSDLKNLYDFPIFIKVNKKGIPDKRLILAIGTNDLPLKSEVIIKDFVIPE
jgi:hypothetical protein